MCNWSTTTYFALCGDTLGQERLLHKLCPAMQASLRQGVYQTCAYPETLINSDHRCQNCLRQELGNPDIGRAQNDGHGEHVRHVTEQFRRFGTDNDDGGGFGGGDVMEFARPPAGKSNKRRPPSPKKYVRTQSHETPTGTAYHYKKLASEQQQQHVPQDKSKQHHHSRHTTLQSQP